jgi:hypothetical protein
MPARAFLALAGRSSARDPRFRVRGDILLAPPAPQDLPQRPLKFADSNVRFLSCQHAASNGFDRQNVPDKEVPHHPPRPRPGGARL